MAKRKQSALEKLIKGQGAIKAPDWKIPDNMRKRPLKRKKTRTA